MSGLQLGGNYCGRRAHYTDNMRPQPLGLSAGTAGAGDALCSTEDNPVRVYDQAWHDHIARLYGTRKVTVTDLSVCRKCARQAEKHGWTVTP